MKFIVEPLDRRHTGHEIWKYRLYVHQFVLHQYSEERFRDFHELRTWMTDQYGPSCERNYYVQTIIAYKGFKEFGPPWCWHIDTEKDYLYIYVRDDTTLSNIQLKWH